MPEFGTTLMVRDPAAIAAAEAAKARIQAAYIMAFQKPRNEDQSRARILQACKRPQFAERVEFAKPVAGRKITGPSIRFAELALREWGNILSDVQVLYEDDMVRRSRVMVLDLETNASFSKEIQVSKTVERRKPPEDRDILGERINSQGIKVFIVRATDDELHNKEAAAISKALRNEGLRIIPSDIVDEAIEVAKKTLATRDAQDPQAAKKKILDAFITIGVQPKDIERYLKHKLESISPKELEDLRGVYRAIHDGEATWTDYIQEEPKQPPPEPQGGVSGEDPYAVKNGVPKGGESHEARTEGNSSSGVDVTPPPPSGEEERLIDKIRKARPGRGESSMAQFIGYYADPDALLAMSSEEQAEAKEKLERLTPKKWDDLFPVTPPTSKEPPLTEADIEPPPWEEEEKPDIPGLERFKQEIDMYVDALTDGITVHREIIGDQAADKIPPGMRAPILKQFKSKLERQNAGK